MGNDGDHCLRYWRMKVLRYVLNVILLYYISCTLYGKVMNELNE